MHEYVGRLVDSRLREARLVDFTILLSVTSEKYWSQMHHFGKRVHFYL